MLNLPSNKYQSHTKSPSTYVFLLQLGVLAMAWLGVSEATWRKRPMAMNCSDAE